MRKAVLIFLSVILLCSCREKEYDVCVYGGTSSGVIAAYTAAKSGLKVVLVEPTEHIGGMTTGGLGYTDIGNKQVVKGLAKQFYRKIGSMSHQISPKADRFRVFRVPYRGRYHQETDVGS